MLIPAYKGKQLQKANTLANLPKVLKVLLDGPFTQVELTEKTGFHYDALTKFMRNMKEAELVYICDWRQDTLNRWSIAVYRFGYGDDKPKPARMPTAIRTKRYKSKGKPQYVPMTQWATVNPFNKGE